MSLIKNNLIFCSTNVLLILVPFQNTLLGFGTVKMGLDLRFGVETRGVCVLKNRGIKSLSICREGEQDVGEKMGEEKTGRKMGNKGTKETARNLCPICKCHNFKTLRKCVVTVAEGEETSIHWEIRISVPPASLIHLS